MSAEKTSTTAASEARRPTTGMIIKIAAILLVTVVVYFLPVPDGVDPRGMHMAGIFAGTILGLILQPLPTTSVALIGLAAAMITGTMDASKEALQGFGNASIWLIVAAFFIADGFLIATWRLGAQDAGGQRLADPGAGGQRARDLGQGDGHQPGAHRHGARTEGRAQRVGHVAGPDRQGEERPDHQPRCQHPRPDRAGRDRPGHGDGGGKGQREAQPQQRAGGIDAGAFGVGDLVQVLVEKPEIHAR